MTYIQLCNEIEKLEGVDRIECKQLLQQAYRESMEKDPTFTKWLYGKEREKVVYDDFQKAVHKYSRKIRREKAQKSINGYDFEYFIQYYNSTAIDDNLYY